MSTELFRQKFFFENLLPLGRLAFGGWGVLRLVGARVLLFPVVVEIE